MYRREDVFDAAVKYFNGDELAANVWIDKYALKDSCRNIYELTPDDMHRRLAKEFARIENNYEKPLQEEYIYELLKDFKYIIPQGSPMAGIGNNFIMTSLSNCFVIPPSVDSYGGIMKTDQEQVQLMKRRGGVGHDLSNIRAIGSLANGMPLNGDTGVPLYMERFSNSTREVAQDGRRGALMLSININHPDANKFIDKKLDTTKVTGANISVKIDDEFMQYRKFGKNHSLWKKIVYNAWKSAEPGILFWDTILKESPAFGYGSKWSETSTNPCGEIPLCPYDSCRLLAINLYSYVENPFTVNAKFNFILFSKHVRIAQKLMDDLVDLEIEKLNTIISKIESDPEDESVKFVELNLWKNIRQMAIDGRRTGLGVTAEGDMLAALGLQYGSDEAIDFSERVHKQLAITAYHATIMLAKERGCFPDWNIDNDLKSNFINRLLNNVDNNFFKDLQNYGRRNIALLTIAPTGTTSLMTQTTSGIEPVFLTAYKRRRKTLDKSKATFVDKSGDMWEEYNVFHHKFITWLESLGWNNVEDRLNELTDDELNTIYRESPYYKATSNDIDYIKKVEMQGRIQKWVDHSISVTVNMRKDVTVEDVEAVYQKAWEVGCKGITIYRDGSRDGVLISNESKEESFVQHSAPKRPRELKQHLHVINIKESKYSVIVGFLNDKPYEIFAINGELDEYKIGLTIVKAKKGVYKIGDIILSENMSDEQQAITRLISTALRHGTDNKFIVEQLLKTKGELSSFNKAIARVLKHYIKDGEKSTEHCENCSGELVYQSGCKTCQTCGWSACS